LPPDIFFLIAFAPKLDTFSVTAPVFVVPTMKVNRCPAAYAAGVGETLAVIVFVPLIP
jgi:hypothetical protein